ncbi:CAP domain-containing protein [bacterium]|nr:CAP domain-containing protein [bacterium]
MRGLNTALLVIICLLWMSACGGSDPVPVPEGLVQHGDATVSAGEQDMINRHNATRAAQGLAALASNDLLNQIAQNHANYLADTGQYVHEDASGGHVWDRADAVGYVYLAIGENVGFDQQAEVLYNNWLGSAGHYGNIVNPDFDEIGVGRATRGLYQYWCVVFGAD